MEIWIQQFMSQFGNLGVFLLIFIENVFPPIPSELILTFGGFMTASTSMSVASVIIFATLGSLLGALLLYALGYLLGSERLKPLLDQYGSIIHLSYEDVQKALKWYSRYEGKTVFFCRMVPLIRSLISIPAGMAKMSISAFILLTPLGSLIWNSVLVFAGAMLGEHWADILTIMDTYSWITYGLLFVGLLAVIIRWIRKKD